MMHDWIQLAIKPQVVRRGMLYAPLVGSLLVAINHGDAIARGDEASAQLVKIGLRSSCPISSLRCRASGRCVKQERKSEEHMFASKKRMWSATFHSPRLHLFLLAYQCNDWSALRKCGVQWKTKLS